MGRDSRPSWAMAVVFSLGWVGSSSGQGLVAPAPGPDLERMSRRMADAVRDLGDDIAEGPGRTPQGQFLERDARELQRATGDWYASIRGNGDPYQIRRSYAGIDVALHRLRGQLDQPGVMDAALADEVRRVDQADAQIHQALGLNAYPPNIEGPAAAPTGQDEVRRLAYTLAQRGEALAAAIRADYGANPDVAFLANDSDVLARTVDGFYDGLNEPATVAQPDFVRSNFLNIIRQANGLGINLARVGATPRVRASWEAYTPAHNQLRFKLGLNAPIPEETPQGANNGVPQPGPPPIPYIPNPTAPIAGWADQLDGQVADLLANFGPTARVVPEGREMLDDMERLRRATIDFRRDVGRGFDAGRLAYEFRNVDGNWQRLARRIKRVAARNGRANGPNIDRVRRIGGTCEQIHQVLGMPGYPPIFAP